MFTVSSIHFNTWGVFEAVVRYLFQAGKDQRHAVQQYPTAFIQTLKNKAFWWQGEDGLHVLHHIRDIFDLICRIIERSGGLVNNVPCDFTK